jgi:SAM-dependent methyltransferase
MRTEQFELHADIEGRHWWFVARRKILSSLVESVLPPSRATTIIDVGCGTGANLAGLAGRYDCVGIDSSSHAVRLARARFPQVRFIHGFAPRDLAGTIERASLILLTDVLEHVADDFALFSELLAAARPGTYFLLTVPADQGLWSEHDESFGHYRRYDLHRFEQIWQGLPVRPLLASYYNTRLYPGVWLARFLSRLRRKSSGLAGTDFRMPSNWVNGLLAWCFAGERHRLTRLAEGARVAGYPFGVSLVALLQRQAGVISARSKPHDLPRDFYDPTTELVTVGS